MLRFFNTLTRKKMKFVPIEKGKVKMYTCGPTVYDYAHIGNFRTYVFQDILRRWLEYRGYKVTQVMNLTDVDDRTINASRQQGIPLNQHTQRYIDAFFDHMQRLNIQKAEHYPRATQHIPEMVALVKKLLEKGYAYKAEDGSIYYNIRKFKGYGKLSKVKLKQLKIGARVKVDSYEKEQAWDFALWKAWDQNDGDVYWETEIGKGRPGWHLECSVMSMKYLGETIDIHSGGVDLIFPHHENEIAQSEALTGKKFVNYWLHSEHLMVEGERMAKSLGNYYTVKDLLDKGYHPNAIRFLLLSTHYRQQLNFTFEGLKAAENTVERLTLFLNRLSEADGKPAGQELRTLMKQTKKTFEAAMDDDLNITAALAAVFDFVRDVNRMIDQGKVSKKEAKAVYDLMMNFDKVLGVMGKVEKKALPKDIEALVQKREEARKAKNWKTADAIRQQLYAMGIILEDTKNGVRWRQKA
ncbi:MAG: cysteine--tRNA ligase [Candidatus Bathyarchaeia archaeon]|jgi:cysteinyl-tRNA synthetase|nr:cysteine--tRNA ligase [Candidatus Bathyarchaeota archaeon A05DMB-4]MDH7594806.1 cysteine--tRNA ligase [Candidatus Bathyarchaeota archaeon]